MDELVSSSFRDTCEFAHGDGQGVHGNGDGFSVEVTGRDNHVLVRENIGIVRGGVNLILNHGLNVHNVVFYRAVHLRNAAETVRVLHMFLGPADEFTSFQDVHEFLAGENLPFVRAQVVGEGKEWFDAAVVGVQRHGANQVGPATEAHAFEDAPDGVGAHELRAVQQRQALFALQADGFPAQFFPDIGGRTDFPFIQYFSQADERQAQVGQGSQVPGGAQRTLLVNHGQDILVEHVNKALHRDKLRAGVPVREGLRLQEEHEFNNLRTHFFAGAARVRHHQVVLQLAQVLLGNGYVVQRPKAGGNAIDGPPDIVHFAVQVFAAFDNGLYGLF